MKLRLSIVAITMMGLGAISTVNAAGFPPAPPVGNLGAIVIDPFGNSPLTALLELNNKKPTNVQVTVKGKGSNGVDISYPVGPQAILKYNAIPVFGLYADFANTVEVSFTLDGKKITDSYKVITSAIKNNYVDSRSYSALQKTKVIKVDKEFKNRLYLVNSHTQLPQGAELHWSGQKSASAAIGAATPATGAIPFESAPMTYIVDTNGDYRWWLDQNAVFDGKNIDVNKRGYLMGIRKTDQGDFTFVQGQRWGHLDLMGQVNSFRLPRDYQDASHESVTMPNGNVLVRAARRNYQNREGAVVNTVRDQILEINQHGDLVDVWSLPEILDPYRDDLLRALDVGAVCVNVDVKNAGKAAGEMKLDAPYGDLPGVGAGRNWAHVNSISYDPKDDGIILSFRHQGIAKVTRDKKVKWILAPRAGWVGELKDKVLQPINAKGQKIECSNNGVCKDPKFEFSYTQHTAWLSPKGTLTVFDNGDARHLMQPAFLSGKYSRFVEYKIDEENMTVEQIWEYGRERGYDWHSPITSNVEYVPATNTMFGFEGSVGLYDSSTPTIGRIQEIDYDTKEVKVEIDVFSDKPRGIHYRGLFIEPNFIFGK